MKSQNDNTSKLDSITRVIGNELRGLNYRKSKRLFNRLQPDGIVHVIDFRMGQNWSSLRGKFYVELGIFLPEIYNIFYEKATPRFATSPYCVERKRLGVLGQDEDGIWWDLDHNETGIENEVLDLLLQRGEQYLLRFGSREKLLSEWEQERQQKKLTQRNILMMAIILSHLA